MSSLQYKLTDRSTLFDNENPWADDYLGRQNAAQSLYRIIEGQENPLTICLNGEWGSGKTFFLKRFERDYNKKEPVGRAVYFNAWEDDFLDDPLLAIISQLKGVAQESTLQSLYKSVKKAAVPFLFKTGAKIGKQLVKQLIGVDVSEVVENDLKTDREDLFGLYDELNKSRRDLRSALTFFAEETFKVTGKPLVFIVDELDRCRPTFAIEVLERIKHLFSVPHLVFLIGVDVRQLSKSIKAVYGDIDANDYLHRFFDVELKLPPADPTSFVYMLWDQHGLEDILKRRNVNVDTQRTTIEELVPLIRARRITLRQIEKWVRSYALLAMSRDSSSCSWAFLAAIAVMLKVTDGDSYNRFIRMDYGLGELVNYLLPDLNARDINSFNDAFRMVDHLSRIAFYRSDFTDAHKRLKVVKDAVDKKSEIKFDAEIMPKCFKECSSESLSEFYQNVFNLQFGRSNEYRGVPSILKQMDAGLRLIAR